MCVCAFHDDWVLLNITSHCFINVRPSMQTETRSTHSILYLVVFCPLRKIGRTCPWKRWARCLTHFINRLLIVVTPLFLTRWLYSKMSAKSPWYRQTQRPVSDNMSPLTGPELWNSRGLTGDFPGCEQDFSPVEDSLSEKRRSIRRSVLATVSIQPLSSWDYHLITSKAFHFWV